MPGLSYVDYSLLIFAGAIIAWVIAAYCQAEFHDDDDDGDETTY
tara:strand:- start:282 stop:413 length:132 start_codon:yes stop_codon:yes gene_type:complete